MLKFIDKYESFVIIIQIRSWILLVNCQYAAEIELANEYATSEAGPRLVD